MENSEALLVSEVGPTYSVNMTIEGLDEADEIPAEGPTLSLALTTTTITAGPTGRSGRTGGARERPQKVSLEYWRRGEMCTSSTS